MNKPRELMGRARELKRWQKHMILAKALYELDPVQLQGIEEEIEHYEQLNKEEE
jgi:hypothetical protein